MLNRRNYSNPILAFNLFHYGIPPEVQIQDLECEILALKYRNKYIEEALSISISFTRPDHLVLEGDKRDEPKQEEGGSLDE